MSKERETTQKAWNVYLGCSDTMALPKEWGNFWQGTIHLLLDKPTLIWANQKAEDIEITNKKCYVEIILF